MNDFYQEILSVIEGFDKLILPEQVISEIFLNNHIVKEKIYQYLCYNPKVEMALRKMHSSKDVESDFTATVTSIFLHPLLIENYGKENQSSVLYNREKLHEIEDAIIGYIDELARAQILDNKIPSFASFKEYMNDKQSDKEEKRRDSNERKVPKPKPSSRVSAASSKLLASDQAEWIGMGIG